MKKISVVIHMLKLWEAGNEVIYAKRKVRIGIFSIIISFMVLVYSILSYY